MDARPEEQRNYESALEVTCEILGHPTMMLANTLAIGPQADNTKGWGIGNARAANGANLLSPILQVFKGFGTEYASTTGAFITVMDTLKTGGAKANDDIVPAGVLGAAARPRVFDNALRTIVLANALDSVAQDGSTAGNGDALNAWDNYVDTLDGALINAGAWSANLQTLVGAINNTNDLSTFFNGTVATITTANFKSHSNVLAAQQGRNTALSLFLYLFARHLNGVAVANVHIGSLGNVGAQGPGDGVALTGETYYAMWRLIVYATYGHKNP
ncbi:MAG: hypothetical protein LBG20_01215 [Holosporaceae bacterium]|nr:hypothetical protein [Holosporaceae bacterium]